MKSECGEARPKNVRVYLDCRVFDENELFQAAMKHAIEQDGLTEDEARELLSFDQEVDVGACLKMILDPGSSPAPQAFDIEESGVEDMW